MRSATPTRHYQNKAEMTATKRLLCRARASSWNIGNGFYVDSAHNIVLPRDLGYGKYNENLVKLGRAVRNVRG